MKKSILLLAFVLLLAPQSFGQVIAQWVGGPSGLWSDASNWSTAPNYPGDGKQAYSVDLASAPLVSIDLDVPIALAALTLSQNVTLNITSPVEGPTPISVSGQLVLAGGLVVTAEDPDAPVTSDAVALITAASASGSFDIGFLPTIPISDDALRFYRLATVNTSRSDARGAGSVEVVLIPEFLNNLVLTDPAQTFNVGDVPADAALGDLNNDGLPDLALAIPDGASPELVDGTVVVLYNAGSMAGVWQGFAGTSVVTVGRDPQGIDIGNADLSGGLDIAVANRADDTAMTITNNGSGTAGALGVSDTVTTGDAPTAISFGELDEDKWDDIATANFGSGDISVFQNLQDLEGEWFGMGLDSTIPVGNGPAWIQFGELDEDKWDDILIANQTDGTVAYIDNMDPPGTFGAPVILDADAGTTELILSDVNGDFANDILTANEAGDSVSIILGNGDGTFVPRVNIDIPGGPRSIASLDLDDDQDNDIVVVADDEGGTPVVRVLRNDLANGQLAFSFAPDIPSAGTPLVVRSGDLNADGQEDLVTVTGAFAPRAARGMAGLGAVDVVLQSPVDEGCVGDCDLNGVVTFSDLVAMLGVFGPVVPGSACDTDANGTLDFSDLVATLSVFGPCE